MTGSKTKPTLGGTLFAEPRTDATATEEEELPESDGDEKLDPRTSARRYWRDPLSGTQREIWRPGDGDGDVEHDHFERRGPLAPIEKRWRLYQLPGPFKFRINEPPNNVILDDRAVHEILVSNIPRAQLPKRWSHDFSGLSAVRHRRAHRGRPAYKDELATIESDKYHTFKPNGKNAPLYPFCGEKEFTPVFYRDLPPVVEESPEPPESPGKPKQHNQYTAPELLVRNGAESASLTKGKYRPRVNTFLRRSPSPPWVKDRKRMFGGVSMGRAAANTSSNTASPSSFDFSFAPAPALIGAPANNTGESMWVEQEEDMKFEDEDEVVLPSIFDPAAVGRSSEAVGGDGSSRAYGTPFDQALERPASSSLFATRTKAPKEMGYIERLAAGLTEEDVQAAAAAAEQFALQPETRDASFEGRVELLERELEAAKNALDARDQEIAYLKSQLEEMQTQMVLHRSVDDS